MNIAANTGRGRAATRFTPPLSGGAGLAAGGIISAAHWAGPMRNGLKISLPGKRIGSGPELIPVRMRDAYTYGTRCRCIIPAVLDVLLEIETEQCNYRIYCRRGTGR